MTNTLKLALRQSQAKIRKNLSLAYQLKASTKICHCIQNLDVYRLAKRLAFYCPHKGEIRLNNLWKNAYEENKQCYFPVLNKDKTLTFLPATIRTKFRANRYGILEPEVDKNQAISPQQLDLILIPLLAFDKQGTRLGMGGGYYDRSLAKLSHPWLIGVAYEFQAQAYIEPEDWDIPLDAVVTPTAVYWFRNPHVEHGEESS